MRYDLNNIDCVVKRQLEQANLFEKKNHAY